MNPKISVIITSYNREKYISAAISSVLQSTFDDWELIIADDCSDDCSHKIACDFAKIDNRIRVIRNEKNIGDYPNRINCIKNANGDWIKFVDCDDFISKDCLQIMYDYACRTNLDFGICAPKNLECQCIDSTAAFDSGVLFYYGPTGSFFKKSKYDSLGGFVRRITVSDWHMWCRFAMDQDIMIFPEYLATWRDHEDNTLKSDNHIEGVLKYYLKSHFEILGSNKHPYDLKKKKKIFRKHFRETFLLCLKFSLRRKSPFMVLIFIFNNLFFLVSKFNHDR